MAVGVFDHGLASDGFDHNAVTTSFDHNTVTTGLDRNTVTTGFDHNTVTTGLDRNTVTTGLDRNTVTTGLDRNTVTTGFDRNTVTTGFDRRAVTDGSRGLQPTVGPTGSVLSRRDKGTPPRRSPQQITLVHGEPVSLDKSPVLLRKRCFRVMLPLTGDVSDRVIHLRLPDRKRRISVLPCERTQFGKLPRNPFRRLPFQPLHPIAQGDRRRQPDQQVNMIVDSPDVPGLDPVGAANPAEVAPDLALDFRSDPWLAVLGGKHEMEMEGRVGVGHGEGRLLPTLLRCRSATQSPAPRSRGLKPTATVHDRSAVKDIDSAAHGYGSVRSICVGRSLILTLHPPHAR